MAYSLNRIRKRVKKVPEVVKKISYLGSDLSSRLRISLEKYNLAIILLYYIDGDLGQK